MLLVLAMYTGCACYPITPVTTNWSECLISHHNWLPVCNDSILRYRLCILNSFNFDTWFDSKHRFPALQSLSMLSVPLFLHFQVWNCSNVWGSWRYSICVGYWMESRNEQRTIHRSSISRRRRQLINSPTCIQHPINLYTLGMYIVVTLYQEQQARISY